MELQRVTIDVPVDVLEIVQAVAEAGRRSRSAQLVLILDRWAHERKRKPKAVKPQ